MYVHHATAAGRQACVILKASGVSIRRPHLVHPPERLAALRQKRQPAGLARATAVVSRSTARFSSSSSCSCSSPAACPSCRCRCRCGCCWGCWGWLHLHPPPSYPIDHVAREIDSALSFVARAKNTKVEEAQAGQFTGMYVWGLAAGVVTLYRVYVFSSSTTAAETKIKTGARIAVRCCNGKNEQ